MWLLALTILNANSFLVDKTVLESMQKTYGQNAKVRFENLVSLLNQLSTQNKPTQLESINDFFNDLNFESDMVVWKQEDYWASRDEFIGMNRGDCEDYSIAKYFSLQQLGFSDSEIYITYVKAIKYRQSHMVLSYFKTPSAMPLILDNINKEVLPASKRDDLVPIFSFNGKEIYMAKQRSLGKIIPQGKINLTQWTDLILKIKKSKQ